MTAGETMAVRADAFEALFLAHYPRVRAVAERTGLDPAESEDVAQEVFAQFYRRHAPDVPYAAAWLSRAAAHLALNAIRTRRRRTAREERDAAVSPASDVATKSADPQRHVEDEERRRAVRAVMARLPEHHSAVLALRYSGMSYSEIGESLGIPASHVGMRLRRAETAFKKEFDHASLG